MKELKIGEEIRIRCVDSDELHSCTECIFFQLECHNLGASCMASERSDKKDVHFEMVEQNEGKELLYAVNKTAERTKKEMIRKACQWCCDKCHEECYYDDKNDCMTIQSITKAMNQ